MVACYSGLPEALVAAVDSDFARTVCALRGAETGFETGPRFEEALEAEGGMAPLGAASFLPTAAVPAGVAVVPEMGPLGGFSCVGDVRYIGLIGALELVKDKKTKSGFDSEKRIGLKVYRDGLKNNIVLRPLGNVIYLFLPLCIKSSELEDILDRTYSVIKSL